MYFLRITLYRGMGSMNVVDTQQLWFALHSIQTIGLVVCQCTSDDECTLYELHFFFLSFALWALIIESSFFFLVFCVFLINKVE